jgi:7-cyano-7-deazaguanine reductase
MKLNERRALLIVSNNPDETLDYISGLQGTLLALYKEQQIVISINYIPDRLIVTSDSFANYLTALSEQQWQNLEELVTTILGDLSNQLVARWICVKGTASEKNCPDHKAHKVIIEDRQPDWNNSSLLSRGELFNNY